jgi:hypothetical protein
MSYQNALPNLNPNEAIADAVHCAANGLNRNDIAILESAITEVSHSKYSRGPTSGEWPTGCLPSTLKPQVFDHIGPMDTTHMIINVRVSHKAGDNVASLTAYALAQYCPPGRGKELDGPKYIAGAEYLVDLVQNHGEGLWKIKR